MAFAAIAPLEMDQATYDSLTPMERNCLRLAQHDRKTEQIAHSLGIAPSTVNTHIFAGRRKMGGLSRLTAADRLREFELSRGARDAVPESPSEAPLPVQPPYGMPRQVLPMAEPVVHEASPTSHTDVREERAIFVFDDVAARPGEQEQKRQDPLQRVLLILAIAALAALILIASPAIYDSAAERVANSLERPHLN